MLPQTEILKVFVVYFGEEMSLLREKTFLENLRENQELLP